MIGRDGWQKLTPEERDDGLQNALREQQPERLPVRTSPLNRRERRHKYEDDTRTDVNEKPPEKRTHRPFPGVSARLMISGRCGWDAVSPISHDVAVTGAVTLTPLKSTVTCVGVLPGVPGSPFGPCGPGVPLCRA